MSSCWLAALCKQLLCLKATALHLGSDYGLKLGRQAAWRPGIFGMVLSSWLAALCKQLLYLKVTARYLGSDCGLKLGRQAAWRPGTFGMVLSSWLAALCKQLLCFKSNCEVLGLWLRAQTRSSSCLAAGVQSEWCCQSGTSGRSVDGGDVVHLWARSCARRSRRGAQLVRLSSEARSVQDQGQGQLDGKFLPKLGLCTTLEDHSPRLASRFLARHIVFFPSRSRQ